MTLEQLIDSRDETRGSTDAKAIVVFLNTPSVEKRFTERQNFASITSDHGQDFSRAVLGKLKSVMDADPLLEAAYYAIAGGEGINFADPITQAMISELTAAKVFTAEQGKALAELGIWLVSPAEDVGLGTVSEADVQGVFASRERARKFAANRDQSHAVEALLQLNPAITSEEMVVRYARGLLASDKADAVQGLLGVK